MNLENETSAKRASEIVEAQPLLGPYTFGSLVLPNRIVMSPMTRGRTDSSDRAPGDVEAEYYTQRASAGLIITGGTYVSPQAVGGIRVPGIYSDSQVEAWKRLTGAVHARDGRIFVQLAHSGSISHPDLLAGEVPVAPSAINPQHKVFTHSGFKDTVTPRSLSVDDIQSIVDDFGKAAKNAKVAGFDGVELHSANIYLLPQFLNSATNLRDDEYGGSPERRARLIIEILGAIAGHWLRSQVGIKLSPGQNGVGVLVANDDTLPTYDYLIQQLDQFALGYLHLMRPINDVSRSVVAVLQEGTYKRYRPIFQRTLIANSGFELESANEVVRSGNADLVSFAKHFIANPDLPERFSRNVPIAEGDRDTYYQGGAAGYISYPSYATSLWRFGKAGQRANSHDRTDHLNDICPLGPGI
ncbi:alkene reductase [Granulicella sp. dw_53]|uniref:alkene reductase n=1 Tax=Granulicella sp. dw_53 TaxID=2719792 RepID=UPI001BD5875E